MSLELNKDSFKAFGRAYSSAGSSNSDFLIKTKGQVKIQWGNKFIDLIKDGKINAETNIIYRQNYVGVKDGIYVIDRDGSIDVILQINGQQIDLKSKTGTTYVSFQGIQDTTSEQKYSALTNIGFLYKDLTSINQKSLQNGIIYIESEKKLYVVQEGNITEFTLDIPTPYNKQIVIQKNANGIGSIVIKGSGIENSLAFDNLYIYNNDDNSYFQTKNGFIFIIDGKEVISIKSDSIIFSDEVKFNSGIISNMIKSESAYSGSGFRLYHENGQSTLEVDNIIHRNSKEDKILNNSQLIQWDYKSNVISETIGFYKENLEEGNQASYPNSFRFSLVFKNEFEINQVLGVYIKEDTSYEQFLILFKVEDVLENNIYVSLIEDLIEPLNDVQISSSILYKIEEFTKLQNIFLISQENSELTLLRRKPNNFDLISVESPIEAVEDNKVLSRFGNLNELNLQGKCNNVDTAIEGFGLYSDNAAFLKAQYINGYDLPLTDKSTNFASTEWTNNLLPKGSIIMYNLLYNELPEGWSVCDGTNNTPDLTDKFIELVPPEENDTDIQSTESDPELQNQYSVVFIMKMF